LIDPDGDGMRSFYDGFLSTSEVLEVFSERSFLAALLRFEAALARAQARAGLIPEAAAQSIIGPCKIELFDVAKIVRDSARAGSMVTPLVKSLRETVGLFNPEAAEFVHLGSTSEEAVDTALALVTRHALGLIQVDVRQAVTSLLALAGRHAADPVLDRSLLQPATATSFGLLCAAWAAPLVRSLQRLQPRSSQALRLQGGGDVETRAAMKGRAPDVMAHMAADLQLAAPLFGGTAQRDEWVALGCELGLLVGSLGQVAKDMALMNQHAVGELPDSPSPAAGRTGLACTTALAASARAPLRVAALLAAMPHVHERALGQWQAELAEWPELLVLAHGSARAMAGALAGLQVDTQRMRANLDERGAGWPPALVKQAAALARAQLQALTESMALTTP
jgi:3-carboxy-cis,cis-muconate cycloisomerase